MQTGTLGIVSNRQDWILEGTVTDDDTNALVDLSAATIVFDVRDQAKCIVLSATNSNGKITFPELGSFQVAFTPDDMSKLCAGPYAVGCTIRNNEITSQLIAASVSVIDGIVC